MAVSYVTATDKWKVEYRGFFLGEFPQSQRDLAKEASDELAECFKDRDVDANEFRDLKAKYAALRRAHRQAKVVDTDPGNAVIQIKTPLPEKVTPAAAKIGRLVEEAKMLEARSVELRNIAEQALHEASMAATIADHAWKQVHDSIDALRRHD